MKKIFLLCLALVIGTVASAQTSIQLRSADKAVCVKSDMNGLKASFSFSTINAEDYESERGTFSWLSMPYTVLGGNEGDPQIPVINQLIAVPFGANPSIEITSYSTTDYRLEDYGMKTLVPRQLPVRKSQRPEDVPFIMNEAAYQVRGLRSEPQAIVSVEGTMRGVQLGKMTIEPVSYDPVNNTIRVFNDIEVTVHFDGADRQATEQMLIDTYSPYFDIVYKSLFNGRAIMDAYTDHPDLYSTPVKMLVVTTSTYANSDAFNTWLTWKKQKGIEVDVQIVTSSTTAANVRSLIQAQYNANHPTFLVIVGDESAVKYYTTYSESGNSYNPYISDNQYASIDSDVYHDMYMSRMAVSSTTELQNLVNKILTYEKYTMSDPSYLNNVLLIAGNDTSAGNWDEAVGRPTIQYAVNNYYNAAHGFTNVYKYNTSSTYTGCYNYLSSGVGFLNYTAHGAINALSDPSFTVSNVSSLTNNDKYFWIVANCCLSANWGNTSTSPCLGEAMIRAANKGAFGYIGSVPETLWYEDYYFGVGAFSYVAQTVQTTSSTSTGMYDALFDDTGFNTLNSVPYIGNVAVTYAHAKGYQSSVNDEYYWRAYQCLGDGSVMPYLVRPAANNVSHNNTIPAGASTFRVNADARSYVAITVNNEIIGVAAVPANATYVDVPFTTTPVAGQTAMIVVTRNQRQPYINNNVPIVGGTEYTISANVSPANSGTITGAGTYYEDTDCTLTATANHGYAFDNWKQGNTVVSTEPSYTFTVTGNATYTANFHALTQHHLTYNPNQTNGTISVSPTDAYAGDIITLTATPAAGYCLDQWHVTTGRAEIPVVNNQFTMPDSDVTITATFKSGYTVTVATVANGTITATPTSAMPGDIITLTATPNTGCEFMTWYAYKTGDPSTVVTVFNNSIRMPSYDVTVSAVFATATVADPTTIGSGTGTDNGQYLPTYNYYNYSLTQQIYTAAEVGSAGTITHVAFKAASNGATRNLAIYMRPTDLTSFTSTTGWETMGDVYLVYSGNVTFTTSGWTTIQLDTPFNYDGVKNINLCVVDNTGSCVSSSSSAMRCYTYSTNANRAMRVYNDNNAYSVGTSDQISNYTGSQVQYNNQVQFTKKLINAETLTVTPNALADFSYVQGNGPSETKVVDVTGVDLSNNITVTAPNGFEISTAANGTYGTSLTIPRATSKGGRATQTWGFEGSMENWTNVDADGDTWGWVLGSAVGGIYLAAGNNMSEGHSGSDMMVSGSYSNVNGVLTPDNWLISPQVELGGTFSMWAKGQDASWFAEHFGIYVSTTNNNISSFQALNEWTLTSGEWKQYSVDLSFFAGQTGYIAVRHFDCTNMFMIDVDDFELNTDATFTPDLPVVITPATVYVRLQDGLDPDTYSGNMTFVAGTVNANVSLNGEVIPGGGEQYTITVNASPAAGGTVTGGGTYYEGSHRDLTATPAAHYTFVGWQLNGNTVSTANPYNITVTGDATYTALFQEMPQYIVTVNQAVGGTITANPTTAYPGDVITLNATAENGYFFSEWNVVDANNQTVTVSSNQFTMPESNVTVTAVFTSGFEVTLTQTPNGTISADKTTAIQPNETVTLTATPDNGCVFLAWYVYKTGNPRDVISVVNNEWFFMPSSDVTVQAIFVTEEEHEQTVGEGTNTSSYLPTYVYRRTICHSLTQQIYTAAEIGYNGRITAIAFKANGSVTRNLDIYMAHSDKTAFSSTTDWEVMGSVAKVYSGSVSFTNNWTTITLDTPFEYDGTSNLNICVVDATSGQVSNTRAFSAYSTGANRAMYVYSTGNNATDYSTVIGYSDQLESTTGTRSTSNNQIKFTIKVPGSAESLTVSPGEIDDFSYEEGQGPSATNKLGIVGVDLSNDISLTAPANFEISLTENGTYSNSLTIARETGSKGNRDVQVWDFEDGLQGWTVADADGDGYNWAHNTQFGGHDGSTGLVYSQSYDNNAGVLTPDNWLISPQVSLGGSFSMWAHPQQAAYPAEHFAILVSTTNTNASSFTLLGEWTLSSGDWKQFSVDLSAFAGQTGYIAVRHFNCSDQFYINVDDFVLDTDASITIEMPVTITPATVYVRMAKDLSSGTYSGTLTASAGTGDNLNGNVILGGEVILTSFTKDITAYTETGGFYFIASPVSTTPTDVTNMLSNTYDLYRFNQSAAADNQGITKEWENYKKHQSDFFITPGQGYLYANVNDVTLEFSGTLYNGNGTFDLAYDDNVADAVKGMNLVGNPYPETATVSVPSFYTMNHDDDLVANTSNTVAAMEGIMVVATAADQTVTFTRGNGSKANDQLVLNISQGRGVIDRAIVRFNNDSQLPKFQLFETSTKLYIPQGTQDFAVVNAEAQGEMPVNFKAKNNGTYTVSVNAENVEFNYLHLIDNMTGADIDLLETPSYSFEANTYDYESRFKLVFAQGNSSNNDNFAFVSNEEIIVNGEGLLQVIDMTGRVISTSQVSGMSNIKLNAAAGVYVLKLNDKTQKIVVK